MNEHNFSRLNEKLTDVVQKVITLANYKAHQQMTVTILSNRLLNNPITNRTIARYIWDLHSMNFN